MTHLLHVAQDSPNLAALPTLPSDTLSIFTSYRPTIHKHQVTKDPLMLQVRLLPPTPKMFF